MEISTSRLALEHELGPQSLPKMAAGVEHPAGPRSKQQGGPAVATVVIDNAFGGVCRGRHSVACSSGYKTRRRCLIATVATVGTAGTVGAIGSGDEGAEESGGEGVDVAGSAITPVSEARGVLLGKGEKGRLCLTRQWGHLWWGQCRPPGSQPDPK